MSAEKLLNCHPLLSERSRLSILAALLAAQGEVPFQELMETLALTKGNLSSHIKKLDEAGLIEVKKEFVDRKPRTSLVITSLGQKELKNYVSAVSNLL